MRVLTEDERKRLHNLRMKLKHGSLSWAEYSAQLSQFYDVE